MEGTTPTQVRVDVLGPLLTKGHELTGRPQAQQLVAALAVAGRPMSRDELSGLLPVRWGKRPNDAAIKRLALRLHQSSPFLGAAANGMVALHPDVAVDAREFVDGVAALGENPSPERLVALMELWRGDPLVWHCQGARREHEVWAELMSARATLSACLAAAGPAVPAERVRAFAELFDEPDDALRAIVPTTQARRRAKRIVVVDDTSAALIADGIRTATGHECVPLGSIDEWWKFVDCGGLADVHGVLVDYHLKRGWEDRLGQTIAEYLRDKTMIPASLLTIMPPTTWPDGYRETFRLVDLAFKGRSESAGLDDIAATVVPRLVGDDDDKRRMRLELFLESAYRKARGRLARPDARLGRGLIELDHARRRVSRAVEDEPLDRATMAVREFRDYYCR